MKTALLWTGIALLVLSYAAAVAGLVHVYRGRHLHGEAARRNATRAMALLGPGSIGGFAGVILVIVALI